MIRRGIRLLSLLGLLAASQASVASAETFAPVDRPGPGLSVDTAAVEKAIVCSPGIDAATRPAVLLLQGTGATAKDNWSWTYAPAFDKLGIPWCALDLPEHATADVQQSGSTSSTRCGRSPRVPVRRCPSSGTPRAAWSGAGPCAGGLTPVPSSTT